ncbi:MAG: sensor histidine kinase [Herpetosiphon sp.]
MISSEQLETLRDDYRQEVDRNRRAIEELERILRQATNEAEKLGQREVNASTQMRGIQTNIDRFSKDDIRNVFATAQEVQGRLLSARYQVEQLQGKQKRLQERQIELGTWVELLEVLGNEGAGTATPATTGAQDHLIGQVIQAQEKERLRLSLQMHDGPAQMLSNLILRAEICERMIGRDVDQTKAELTGLKNAINTVLQDTRRFIFDLRPMILDDLGLIPTLRRYSQDMGQRWNIEIQVAAQNLDARLPSHYEVSLFRFIQEALNNVHKHASATSARIVIDGLGTQIQVMIEDDGSGFNVSDVINSDGGHRDMGLAVMKQQVETLLKGRLAVESTLGRGTRVIADVPMPSA